VDKTEMLDIVGDVDGKTAVIVDDMISTGGTLVEAVKLLRARGADKIYVCATHGVFAGEALDLIAKSDIDELFVTDTIHLPVSAPEKVTIVSVAPLLAEAIMRTHKGMSISALFT
jgi:ribose-phosphate pyrophosphokinase